MKVYDTVIIGCGYAPFGYALTKGNCAIIEKKQSADTRFYLPLKNFKTSNYTPKTQLGKQLLELYVNMGLIKNEMINLGGLECGFCEFISNYDVDIYFKSRVISISQKDGLSQVLVHGVSGITTIYAKQVIDSTKSSNNEKYLTILYATEKPEEVKCALENAFEKCLVETAFFDDRYAVHLPVCEQYNTAKRNVFEKWKSLNLDAKIIHMSPVLGCKSTDGSPLNDDLYDSPIQAIDSGVEFANSQKEEK